jgi:hypothetical protein
MEGAPPRPRIVTPAGLVELHRQQDPRPRAAAARGPDMMAEPQTAREPDARQRAAIERSSQGDVGVFHHACTDPTQLSVQNDLFKLCIIASQIYVV